MTIFLSDQLTQIENQDFVDPGTVSGKLLVSTSVINLTVEPVVSDVLLFAAFPSNSKLKTLTFYNDDLDTGNTVAVDVGLYAANKFVLTNGETFDAKQVINPDVFAKDENFGFQVNIGEDIRFHTSGSAFINNGGYSNAQDYLWQLAGVAAGNLTADPGKDLIVGVKIVGAFATFQAGKILLISTWTGSNP